MWDNSRDIGLVDTSDEFVALIRMSSLERLNQFVPVLITVAPFNARVS